MFLPTKKTLPEYLADRYGTAALDVATLWSIDFAPVGLEFRVACDRSPFSIEYSFRCPFYNELWYSYF